GRVRGRVNLFDRDLTAHRYLQGNGNAGQQAVRLLIFSSLCPRRRHRVEKTEPGLFTPAG
ncbi:MAG: hypothetical protein CMG91_14005, partial [Marinobacter sp.]|nr:hypothetical protein [Marinobacter sp.]